MRKKRSRKKLVNSIVQCCIDRLLKQAEENYKSHPERTRRYLSLVLKFIKRYKVRVPREKRLKFCKKCLVYWVKGDTLSFSCNSKSGTEEYKCNNCEYVKRIRHGKDY